MLAEKNMVQKRNFYEWSARVPLIFRFPDKAYAGSTISEAVNLIDVLPTVLDYLEYPEEEQLPMDGCSLLPVITGVEKNRTTFSENHSDGNIHEPCVMARKGPWKYIYIHNHRHQLFNLDQDPEEWENRIDDPDCANVAAMLRTEITVRFDLERIKTEVTASIARRKFIHAAMERNGTDWSAEYDQKYVR